MKKEQPIAQPSSRRDFLERSATLAGGAAVAPLAVSRAAHAAGSDVLRVGLIGCGGRGSGAAVNAMNAGEDVRLVAMGDVFADRAQAALKWLTKVNPGPDGLYPTAIPGFTKFS